MQRARRAQAAVLTGIAVAIVAAVGATLGPLAFVLAAITVPLPVVVLWLASDVLRADEWREQRAAPRAATAERSAPVRRAAESVA